MTIAASHASNTPRHLLITGPRRSGKTHEAARLASTSGKRIVVVLAEGSSFVLDNLPSLPPAGCEVRLVRAIDKPSPEPGCIYVVNDVCLMSGVEALHALALGLECDVIFVASAPTTAWHAALIDLLSKWCEVVELGNAPPRTEARRRFLEPVAIIGPDSGQAQ